MNEFVPPAFEHLFKGAIRHPGLYLWDAWSYVDGSTIHLYCLAVNRMKPDGSPMTPFERNDYPFHVRHFTSSDDGKSWRDQGCFQKPGVALGKQDERNIWSGSIEPLSCGQKLVSYTGIYEMGGQRNFLQNIALAYSADGYQADRFDDSPLCCPVRDRELILARGYYLDRAEKLGHDDGEEGGPVMTWRDPFIVYDQQEQMNLLWSAKSAPTRGVIAHAVLSKTAEGFVVETLLPPIELPDSQEYTQAELPKVYFDPDKQCYYLIVSTCNRLFEGQQDIDVDKTIRLYKSDSVRGPWHSLNERGSRVKGAGGLFGMTVLKTDFENNRMLCMSPYTDAFDPILSLTFSKVFYLDLQSASLIKDF